MRLANVSSGGKLRGPLRGPVVWRGDEISDPQYWSVAADTALVSRLRAAIRNTADSPRRQAGREFRWPASLVAKIKRHLFRGRGLVVVKGLPVSAEA